jgi:hypothetical protein
MWSHNEGRFKFPFILWASHMISYFKWKSEGFYFDISAQWIVIEYCNITTQVLNNLFILKLKVRHVSF